MDPPVLCLNTTSPGGEDACEHPLMETPLSGGGSILTVRWMLIWDPQELL